MKQEVKNSLFTKDSAYEEICKIKVSVEGKLGKGVKVKYKFYVLDPRYWSSNSVLIDYLENLCLDDNPDIVNRMINVNIQSLFDEYSDDSNSREKSKNINLSSFIDKKSFLLNSECKSYNIYSYNSSSKFRELYYSTDDNDHITLVESLFSNVVLIDTVVAEKLISILTNKCGVMNMSKLVFNSEDEIPEVFMFSDKYDNYTEDNYVLNGYIISKSISYNKRAKNNSKKRFGVMTTSHFYNTIEVSDNGVSNTIPFIILS